MIGDAEEQSQFYVSNAMSLTTNVHTMESAVERRERIT